METLGNTVNRFSRATPPRSGCRKFGSATSPSRSPRCASLLPLNPSRCRTDGQGAGRTSRGPLKRYRRHSMPLPQFQHGPPAGFQLSHQATRLGSLLFMGSLHPRANFQTIHATSTIGVFQKRANTILFDILEDDFRWGRHMRRAAAGAHPPGGDIGSGL